MKALDRLKKVFSDKSNRNIFLYTFVCGLIAHGFVFFNKFAWHDELQHGFQLSATKAIRLGRWMRAGLGWIVQKVFGGYNLSLPLIHGLISVFFISLSVFLIIHLFDIKEKSLRILIAGLLVSFPVVTSTFGYMFTAPYYFMALFCSTFAVWLASRKICVWRFLLSAAFICAGMAIYQPYFAVGVSLFVLMVIFGIIRGRYEGIAGIFKEGFYYVGILAAGFITYMITWKGSMKILGIEAGDYQGISSIGEGGLGKYVNGIVRAYRGFFLQKETAITDIFPMALSTIQWIIIVSSILLAIVLVIRQFMKHKGQAVLLLLLMVALPVAFNIVFVMASASEDSSIHSLMMYGISMLYVFFVLAVREVGISGKKASEDDEAETKTEKAAEDKKPAGFVLGRLVYCGAVLVLSLMLFLMMYLSNSAYLRADMQQQQTISDLTILTAKIKSTEGYKDTMKVCFVMSGSKDETRAANKAFSNIAFMPYTNIYPYHNQRNLKNYLEYWIGFTPAYASPKKFEDMEEVKNMPSYPDDGSIRIIKKTVVVKW